MFRIGRITKCAIAGLVAIAVVGLVAPLSVDVQATSGRYYAYTYYKTYEAGVSGSLTITNPSPYSQSGDANFVVVFFANGDWLAIGYLKGNTPWGGTGSSVYFYYDQSVNGVYSGGLLNTASVNSVHSFKINYQLGSLNKWSAYIDGVSKKTTQYSDRTAIPSAQAEMHNDLDSWQGGHVAALQYCMIAGRIVRWYSWDGYGYGSPGADNPPYITVVSNTEWTFNT